MWIFFLIAGVINYGLLIKVFFEINKWKKKTSCWEQKVNRNEIELSNLTKAYETRF